MLITIEINEKQLDDSPVLIVQLTDLTSDQWSVAYDLLAQQFAESSVALGNHKSQFNGGDGQIWAKWPEFEAILQDDFLTITFTDIDESVHLDEVWSVVMPAFTHLFNRIVTQ